jgi:LPS sulfotransferase NodH
MAPYLKRLALDTGMLPGGQDYTKFIVMTRSRTGSEFLLSLLNSHSQIAAYGEIFQKGDEIDWDFSGYYRSGKKRTFLQKHPVSFLKNEFFRTYPKKIKAVGFKIFYYHAQQEKWKSVWTYLKDMGDLKVIHLRRRNILRTLVSRKHAVATGKWINLSGEKEDIKPMVLNYEECLEFFEKTRNWEDEYDSFFKDHDRLNVYYLNLCNDTNRVLSRIQAFLNVKEERLISQTKRQNKQLLSQSILNYQELKEQFKGTTWEMFFEE